MLVAAERLAVSCQCINYLVRYTSILVPAQTTKSICVASGIVALATMVVEEASPVSLQPQRSALPELATTTRPIEAEPKLGCTKTRQEHYIVPASLAD